MKPDLGEMVSPSALLARMRCHLAIRGWTRPREFAPDGIESLLLLEVIGNLRPDCEIGRGEHEGAWRMLDRPRTEILTASPQEEILHAAITVFRETGDVVAGAIVRALSNVDQDHRDLTARELSDWIAARRWLSLDTATADGTDILLTRKLFQATRRDDLKRMTSHGVFDRERHLKGLSLALSVQATPDRASGVLVNLFGKGGAGKSTLLACLMERLPDLRPDMVAVMLDFDRVDLDLQAPATLDREILTQMGHLMPELSPLCAEVASDIRRNAMEEMQFELRQSSEAGVIRKRIAEPSLSFSKESANSFTRSSLMGILSNLHYSGHALVLVLDTFERVESAGETAVEAVFRWARNLGQALGEDRFFLIVSGRVPLPEAVVVPYQVTRIELGDLSEASARRLLRARGCDGQIARDMAAALPSRTPLVLHLAAQAAVGRPESEQVELVEALRAGCMPGELVAGYLYERILKHIDLPLARKYAFPALALPEITVDLVQQVLIPEVEPDMADLDRSRDAERIFRELGAINWLVQPARDQGRLRLRSDLRALMMDLVGSSTDSANMANAIRQRAISYHAQRQDAWDQAMALYHRLMTDSYRDSLVGQAAESIVRAARYLRPFVDELPKAAQLLISDRAGDEVDLRAARHHLPDREWADLMLGVPGRSGRGQGLVDQGDPLTALNLYQERPFCEIGRPPTFVLQAMCDSAQWDVPEVRVEAMCQEMQDHLGSHPRKWRPMLLRLHWLTRLCLFRSAAPLASTHVELLKSVMPRCLPYGVTLQIADTIAIAEALENARLLHEQFLAEDIPAQQLSRIAAIHQRRLGEQSQSSVPLAGLVAFQYEIEELSHPVVLAHVERELGVSVSQQIRTLHGKSWSVFQSMFRKLQKVRPLPALDALPLWQDQDIRRIAGLWPEFYRPLRQALLEAFPEPADIIDLGQVIRPLFSLTPREFLPESFNTIVSADPPLWLLTLVQLADRAKVMLDLAEAAADARPRAQKLRMVTAALHNWHRLALEPGVGRGRIHWD